MSTIAILPILMMVLLVFGGLAAVVFFAVRALANNGAGSGRGLGRFLATIAVIGLAGIVGWRWLAQPHSAPAVIVDQNGNTVYLRDGIPDQLNWLSTGNPQHDQMRIALDVNQRIKTDPSAQAVVDEVAKELGGLNRESMQEIWERLHTPRIALGEDSGDPGAEIESATDEGSDSSDVAANSREHSQGTAETLANKAERVARLARLLAVVADQVSDVASAVGRGFVAADQPPKAQSAEVEAAAEDVTLAEHVEEDQDAKEAIAGRERPAWVDAPPKRFGENWREVVMVGDYATRSECEREADRALLLAAYRHLLSLSGASNSRQSEELTSGSQSGNPMIMSDGYWGRPTEFGVGIDYIRREIVKEQYFETVERSFGDMERLYLQLVFTPGVDRELKHYWDVHRRGERLAMVGAGTGSLLGLIALVFGLLKMDTWTRGYYTKRLFLGVPAAIIGLIALLALMVG